jgi:hypothetical protein
MILDGALMFDNPSSLAIAAGTQASANTLDLGTGRDLGVDTEIEVEASVTTTFTSGGAGTLQLSVQGSVDNSTWTTMASSRVFALAELVAGALLDSMKLPRTSGTQAVPRYLRLLWTVGTATMTAGAVQAGLNRDRQKNISYPPGVAITN